ncbi:MAG: hypothetical protein LBM65_02785, partial [Oscillospiraceae bacterium]|nr:hypothetical protein [Oscillospiraceae bacterium]
VVAAVVKNEESAYKIDTDCIVLAIGHSARDTFEMLNDKKIPIESKAFSIGVRIEHLAKAIDSCQYGTFAGNARLGAASYKLNTHLANGRGVYTFCMCPGGRVVAAQSEENSIVTNGMSNFARRGDNSNSAILVSVSPDDFGDLGPLAGVHFQRKIEKSAYTVSGNYNAPAQKVGDFLKKQTTTEFSNITPSYLPGVAGANIWDFLPEYVCDSIALSLEDFSRKIPEFANPNAVITAPETRSSSPIRILRNPTTMQSIGINGLFPCGEGAGYAGGIISAAIDGIKCAEAILKN